MMPDTAADRIEPAAKAFLANNKDDEMVGRVFLVTPSMMMLEVFIASRTFDMAAAHILNMEGGRTGRDVHFAPSRMVREIS